MNNIDLQCIHDPRPTKDEILHLVQAWGTGSPQGYSEGKRTSIVLYQHHTKSIEILVISPSYDSDT